MLSYEQIEHKDDTIIFSSGLNQYIFSCSEKKFWEQNLLFQGEHITFSQVYSLSYKEILIKNVKYWEVKIQDEKEAILGKMLFLQLHKRCYPVYFLSRILGKNIINGKEDSEVLLAAVDRISWYENQAEEIFSSHKEVSICKEDSQITMEFITNPSSKISGYMIMIATFIIGCFLFIGQTILRGENKIFFGDIWQFFSVFLFCIVIPALFFYWEISRQRYYRFKLDKNMFQYDSQEINSPKYFLQAFLKSLAVFIVWFLFALIGVIVCIEILAIQSKIIFIIICLPPVIYILKECIQAGYLFLHPPLITKEYFIQDIYEIDEEKNALVFVENFQVHEIALATSHLRRDLIKYIRHCFVMIKNYNSSCSD